MGADEGFGGEDELIEGRVFDLTNAATLTHGGADAAAGDAGGEEAESLLEIGAEASGGGGVAVWPEDSGEAIEYELLLLEEALDFGLGGEEAGEEAAGVGLLAGGGKDALDDATEDFGEESVLAGEAGFGEERDGVEIGEHRVPGLLEADAEGAVLLEETDPAEQADDRAALGGDGPDGGEELGGATGAGVEGGGVAEGLGEVAEFDVDGRESAGRSKVRAAAQELSQSAEGLHVSRIDIVEGA
jgi:hypothetical protein